MPLPKPKPNEKQDDFIDRCMGDDVMNEEFPDTAQRRAVCQRQWDDKDKKKAISILPQVYGKVWAIVPDAIHSIMAQAPSQPVVDAAEFEAYRQKESTRFNKITGQVHILPLQGMLTPKASILSLFLGGTPLDFFAEAFDSAMANDKVGAIVLDIDSPGGSVYGVHELAEKIYKARGKKPIIASVNGLGASAAYWIASAADEIVVTPSGEVGSIGVIAIHEDISGLNEKLGLKYTMLTAGKYKAEGIEHEPLTDEAKDALQQRVDEYYDMMTKDIARNRGVTQAKVKSGFGEGRVLGAKQAKTAGVIDHIATMERVLTKVVPLKKRMAAMRERIDEIKSQV
ncbi:MAG: signal peptide peptidase SppA [Planctomycetota bacterium]|jgi:signal peptide peptidase SppA